MLNRIYSVTIGNESLINPLLFFRFYLFTLFDRNVERRKFLKLLRGRTMVGYKRIATIWNLCLAVNEKNLLGNFVECGVWKGGVSAVLCNLSEDKPKRKVFLFDSFEGLPEPTKIDGRLAIAFSENRKGGRLISTGKNVASKADVETLLFDQFGFDSSNVIVRPGWFQNTLGKNLKDIDKISLLVIDADWYESVSCCLDMLYDSVVVGGFVVIDDYGTWPGCKLAVDEFLLKRKEKVELVKIDRSGYYLRKTK